MLKSLLSIGQILEPKENSATFKMVNHDRTAGSMPVWEKNSKASSAKEQTAARFADALNATKESVSSSPFRMALAPSETAPGSTGSPKPFGFGDILDIVNPLHHIPLIGSLYRNISGDEIRGPGRILGGAIFGGPLGAASSMVNMLIEYDTGQDITAHALNMVNGHPQTEQTSSKALHRTKSTSNPALSQAILAYQQVEANNPDTPQIRTVRL